MVSIIKASRLKYLILRYYNSSFTVLSSGSDFYHAHVGAQRTMGLFGALKIRSKSNDNSIKRDPDIYPDYVMMLNEWNHHYDSTSGQLRCRIL